MRWITLAKLAFTVLAGLASASAPATADAQTLKSQIHVGVISFAEPELRTHLDKALVDGFRERGYVEGANLILEWRYADGDRERVPQVAKELAGMNLDAIVTTCTPTTRATVIAAPKTPIVMAAVSDPVGQGLIASYRHPGGEITGTASQFEDLAAKMFQLLHEMAPKATSIGVLFNPGNPVHKVFLGDIETASKALGLKVATFQIGQLNKLETTFDSMHSAGVDAVVVLPDDSFLFNLRRRIIEKLANAKLPSIFGIREAAEDGGLMSYGESLSVGHFRAAYFVDRIAHGSKPAGLPVEQPTKFELIVNRKIAKVLGLSIPPSLLARADEVIE